MARSRNDNFKVTFTSNMDAKLLQEFRDYCRDNNLYQNEVIEDLVREWLKDQSQKKDVVKVGDSN